STPIKPTIATIVSMAVHDWKVSFMLKLKYSFTSQKPPSLKWENIKLPAPMEITIRLGSAAPEATRGEMIPAAVRPATVADPTAILIRAAINQPKNKGFMSHS